MKKLLLFINLLFIVNVTAQSYKFNISGTILSETDKSPIEAATIHLEKTRDSTVVTYTISDDKGNFSLAGSSYHKKLKLYISFIGMENFSKEISLDKTATVKLGSIYLKEASNLLNEVVVKSRAPITIKKDTLEFNVKSFKTKKDANVEDLLKKLPGVEVDEDGKITVNGKPVNKILVNGKPFFGDDPTITTKNLSKEIIEKIQITDTKSKSEAFSGEDGDANNKTINLTISKENNKGWFGRVSGGLGTDERYEAATMINRFDNDTRFSVLASANNINSLGFSFGEIRKMFGNGGNFFNSNGNVSANNGIVTSETAGATYADEFKKNVGVNANYFLSKSNADNASRNSRAYTVITDDDELKYFTNSNTTSNGENTNHKIDAEIDIEIDSTFLINVTPSFVFNNSINSNITYEESLDSLMVLTNQYASNTFITSDAKNFENNIDITKKIGANGSFIKATIVNQIDIADSEELNSSTIETFGASASSEIRNQKSTIDNDLNRFETRFSYRYPIISKKLFIDLKYNYQLNERENIENTFDFDETLQRFSSFNTDLSSDFIYNDITKKPTINFVYNPKGWRFNFEIGQEDITLISNDNLRPELSLEKNFKNLTLRSTLSYKFKSKASIYMNYELRNNAPSLNQIQPFTDVSNPSNLITGNPNLKPNQNHNYYLNFNKYDWQKRTGFYAYISGNFINNQIVSETTLDTDLISNTTYTNANGSYRFWAGSSYTKSVKLDSVTEVKLRVGAGVNGSNNISIFNGVKNNITSTTIRPSFGIDFKWNKLISIEPRYTVSFTNTNQNQNFTSHTLNIQTRTNFPKRLEWRNTARYTYNPNLIGFNKAAWFWNSTVTYAILNDKVSLSLKAYDLLNQNTNAIRTAVNNYIEDSENTILQQYFMLGVSWKFNSLGKKGEVKEYGYYF